MILEIKDTKENLSKLVLKTLRILEVFIDSKNKYLSLKEIGEKCRLNKSGIHRILKSLEEKEFIEQNKDNRKYRLGKKFLILGLVTINSFDLRGDAIPYLRRLSDETGETVNFGILDDNEVLYLEIIKGKRFVHMAAKSGCRDSLYSTALGRVLLSAFSDKELDNYFVETDLNKKTKKTVTDKDKLIEAVNSARKNSYSFENSENEEGLSCIGVPIRDYNGDIIAAVSISFLNLAVSEIDRNILKSKLIETGKELSERFKYFVK